LLCIQHAVDGSLRRVHPAPQFSLADIPDQSGKHALITGATSGIGKAMAMELARRGAHVLVGARDEGNAQETVAEIIGETGASAAMVEPLIIDLGSLASVKAAADLVNTRE
jgi:NAD(P)-dependent dehydrogenase (short-subunit alcohol dehydrogenase family)